MPESSNCKQELEVASPQKSRTRVPYDTPFYGKTGETVTIRRITGKDKVRQHLSEPGFVVDGTLTVVSETAGNFILQVKNSRVALAIRSLWRDHKRKGDCNGDCCSCGSCGGCAGEERSLWEAHLGGNRQAELVRRVPACVFVRRERESHGRRT